MPRRDQEELVPAAVAAEAARPSSSSSVLVRPKEKDIEQAVTEYIGYFERIVEANDWEDERAGKVFQAMFHPRDQTLRTLTQDTLKGGFKIIKESLLEKQQPFREANLCKLMSIRMNEDESVRQFRSRILMLIELVYPELEMQVKLQLARDFFLHGLPNGLRSKIMGLNSKTLDETVNVAESFQAVEDSRESKVMEVYFQGKPTDYKRNVYGSNVQNLKKKTNQSVRCFRCNKLGHMARFCRNILEVRSENRFSGNDSELLEQEGNE